MLSSYTRVFTVLKNLTLNEDCYIHTYITFIYPRIFRVYMYIRFVLSFLELVNAFV